MYSDLTEGLAFATPKEPYWQILFIKDATLKLCHDACKTHPDCWGYDHSDSGQCNMYNAQAVKDNQVVEDASRRLHCFNERLSTEDTNLGKDHSRQVIPFSEKVSKHVW